MKSEMKGKWWYITGIYFLLIWLYIVVRIVVSKVQMNNEFIDGIPVNFWQLGIICFSASYLCMIWGSAENGILPRVRFVRVED